MTHYNPYELLKKEGIAKSLLSGKSKKVLEIYDKSKGFYDKRPDNEGVAANFETTAEKVFKIIEEDIHRIKKEAIAEQEKRKDTAEQKALSKKVLEKTAVILDDLALCRQRLREDRKAKIASGEIKTPKKKTILEKLRMDLIQISILIPEKLRGNKKIMQATEKAILNFLHELKKIWSLNKVKIIEDELAEKFKKMADRFKN